MAQDQSRRHTVEFVVGSRFAPRNLSGFSGFSPPQKKQLTFEIPVPSENIGGVSPLDMQLLLPIYSFIINLFVLFFCLFFFLTNQMKRKVGLDGGRGRGLGGLFSSP